MRTSCRLVVLLLLPALAPVVAAGGGCPPASAVYRLTFDGTWSAATHPQSFPPGPHFSPLVGGTHDSGVAFWTPGETASDGIERMAELGTTSTLVAEVETAIAAGSAGTVITGGGIGTSPGSVSVDFTIGLAHPLATVVSMIAPSPDWFVGVNGLALVEQGNWVDELVVELAPYDAGTDSGVTFLSPNADTNPAEPIAQITGEPFLNGAVVLPLGTFTFQRLTATCTDTDSDGLEDAVDNCTLVPNPGQRDSDADAIGNACDPDIVAPNDCRVGFEDLNGMKLAFFSEPADDNWNPHADFDGDDLVGFSDLDRMKLFFFAPPGPSAGGCN